MRKQFPIAAAVTLCFLTAVSAGAETLVLRNARIYTVEERNPWVEALAIDDKGVLLSVGTEEEVLGRAGDGAKVVDLKGRMVLPGFQDVHVHAVEAGMNALLCEFDQFGTLDDHIETVAECAEMTSSGWVLGSGVNMGHLLELTDDPRAVLDEALANRPVLILDDVGHGAWINSAAMKAAGYDTAPDESNGNIILRKQDGAPNGVVLENAQQRLRTLALLSNKKNQQLAYDGLLDALKELNKNGITSVSDAGGYWPQGHQLAWQRAEREGTLSVRASNAFYIYPDQPLADQLVALKKLYSNDSNRLLRFNVAKIYVDGILEQTTAALLDRYEKQAGARKGMERGYLYFPESSLYRAAREFSQAGFQLHFHVTGDRGARLALNAIEQADRASGPHRLTHIYLADPQDLPRFAKLSAIADLQLAPSAVDPRYVESMKRLIGDRVRHLMPAGALVKAGATVTLSSDWDADELNPLIKIQTAVSRPSNGLPDVATAIKAYTINAAVALRQSDRTGSIKVGKFADLVVLSGDIMNMPIDKIGKVRVEATLLQGEPVFDQKKLFDE